MKTPHTPLTLMQLFTKERKPTFEYSPLELRHNSKDYSISERQYQWLLAVVYTEIKKDASRVPNGWVPINGVTYTAGHISYSIVSVRRKTCIRVSDWTPQP